jgi:hypothetical protein
MPAGTGTTAEASSGGGYEVAVASERSAADADAVFRSMQAKFPNQLGGREPIVRRTVLGPEGTYYRASIGPFVSMKAAARVCNSLKAAGESCLVEKNWKVCAFRQVWWMDSPFVIGSWFRRENMNDLPPTARVMQVLMGVMNSAAVSAIARLGIPDHLHSGPKTVEELARAVGAKPELLFRLMPATAGLGVLAHLSLQPVLRESPLTAQAASYVGCGSFRWCCGAVERISATMRENVRAGRCAQLIETQERGYNNGRTASLDAVTLCLRTRYTALTPNRFRNFWKD